MIRIQSEIKMKKSVYSLGVYFALCTHLVKVINDMKKIFTFYSFFCSDSAVFFSRRLCLCERALKIVRTITSIPTTAQTVNQLDANVSCV